ncbi:hypothetical protein R1sor_019428 [Riccia sorocarpa]|uniref:Uncharacterized protein n=1 Tax=Riccia sorocarpa TaxID=122646 RepID=A0ABD3ID34_9MARC
MGEWLKKALSVGDPEQSGTSSGPGAWRERGSPSATTDHFSNGANARRVDLFNGRGLDASEPNRVHFRNNIAYKSSPDLNLYIGPRPPRVNVHSSGAGQSDLRTTTMRYQNRQGERFSPRPSSPSNGGIVDYHGHPNSPQGHIEERSSAGQSSSPNNQGWTSPQYRNEEPQDSQTNSPLQPLGTTACGSKGMSPVGSPSKAQSWADKAEEEEVNAGESEDDFNISDINSEQRADQDFMAQRNWVKEARREVTDAFSRIQEFTGTPEAEEVAVEHHFNTEEQMQIHAQKRRLEDCVVVFCTVDISPSRDAFTQWLYQEVENKSDVQEPDPEAGFTEVTGKGKNKVPNGSGSSQLPEQRNSFQAPEETSAGDQMEEVTSAQQQLQVDNESLPMQIGNDEDTGVTSVDPLAAEGLPQQTTHEVNETLPDLNVTLTASTGLHNEKTEKKKSKKARQKEKRRETLLAKMAETGTQNRSRSQTDAMEAEESGESSLDEEDSRKDRLWKKKDEKKQKGEKEVMETTVGWKDQPTKDGEDNLNTQ